MLNDYNVKQLIALVAAGNGNDVGIANSWSRQTAGSNKRLGRLILSQFANHCGCA